MSRLRVREEQPDVTGLRRVDWVRFLVDLDAVRAEAVGVGYRLPVARPIPLSLATAIVAQGTPSVTQRLDDGADLRKGRR
jgi:Lon protease-like protein